MKRVKKSDDIPEITDQQFADMKPLGEVFPEIVNTQKTRITIRLDNDVLSYFKNKVPKGGYQALINSILSDYVKNKQPLEALLRRVVREEIKGIR